MKKSLTGRTAFVAGGSYGVGKTISEILAREGAQVILCSRTPAPLQKTVQTIQKRGGRAQGIVLDITDPVAVEKVFKKIKKLDILVNSAGGVPTFGAFHELDEAAWIAAYKWNCLGAVHCARAAAPLLQKSKHGRIVNISSIPAKQPGRFNPHYSAAKAALLNFSKHLSNVLAQHNITVNAICPSTLKGGGWERNAQDRAQRDNITVKEALQRMEQEELKKLSLGFMGTPDDVASLVAFLASDGARFITGTCIDLDGGTVRSMI